MLREGDHIESYTLVSQIGGGSFASVWSARDKATGDDVALKILHEQHAYAEGEDGLVRERFLAEARLLRQLTDPGVVRVLKIIEAPALGIYAFAMELLRGYDLYALLGKLDLEKTLTILARAAEILDGLHERGIVHRDLKLSNIFVTAPEGVPAVKLIDFCIPEPAKTADGAPKKLIGTIPMMPPEVMRRLSGEPIALTAAIDQWTFGVAMYHALTGRLPFHGRTVTDQIEQVLHQPHPAPVFMRAYKKTEFPPELAAVLDRCLAKDPAARYPSMKAVAEALYRWVRACEERRISDTLEGGPTLFDEPTEAFTRTPQPRALSSFDTSLEMPAVPRVPVPLRSASDQLPTPMSSTGIPLPTLSMSANPLPTPLPTTSSRVPTPDPSLTERLPTPLPELIPARVFARRTPRESDTPLLMKAPARPQALPIAIPSHPVTHTLSVFWAGLGVVLVGIAAYLVGWVSS